MPIEAARSEKANAMRMGEQFLRVKEVARRVGVSDRTVRNWIKQKRLAAKRIGGVVRVMRSDLERAMKPQI